MPSGNLTSYPSFVESALISQIMAKKRNVSTTRAKTRRRGTRKARSSVPAREQARLAQLNSRVNRISRSLKSDQAVHTHRRRDVLSIGANARECVNTLIQPWSTGVCESAMAFLRYYDPATPGTLVTADASTGTYERQVHFESVYEKLTIRNNYQVPCNVTVWMCTPKNDTNISPASFYSAGVADQTIGPIAVGSPLLYPSDIDQVTSNWNLKRVATRFLDTGKEMTCKKGFGAFDYSPAQVDQHALQFQAKYKGHVWYVRVEGTIGHDTSNAEYLTTAAQVDCLAETKSVITYDAGVNLRDFSEDNNQSASFTNAGVVANKAVSDNQSFSVA